MTNPTATLPTLALDYQEGVFTNSLTGERTSHFDAVPLAFRHGRTLWPSLGEEPRLPLCVDGSAFGPCLCAFAEWGPRGEAPDCSEELSVLLYDDTHAQAVVLTARRTQLKVLDQWLGMKAALSGTLHDQRVQIGMRLGDGLHRLIVLPGQLLDPVTQTRMNQLAGRVQEAGLWGGL